MLIIKQRFGWDIQLVIGMIYDILTFPKILKIVS